MQLHPHFPVFEGFCPIDAAWSILLPMRLNRRVEDGSLVIWRPGFTIWASLREEDNEASKEARLASIEASKTEGAYDIVRENSDGVLRYAYRLEESRSDAAQPSLNAFAVTDHEYLQFGIYFDSESDVEPANSIWRSAACSTVRSKERAAEQAKRPRPPLQWSGGCICTNRVAKDGLKVDYMYRVATDREADSGWRFFGGDEDSEYLGVAANSAVLSLGAVADCDPDVIPFLEIPPPCAFEKRPESGTYEQVPHPEESD